jgi:hypothetical protein
MSWTLAPYFSTHYDSVSYTAFDNLQLQQLKYRTKQDRQCTYNVTLGRVHETIVVVEKQ